tara:strand:+ start:59 stop:751 length:693 start_codon:yes stop_codon:yes gene_type:complete
MAWIETYEELEKVDSSILELSVKSREIKGLDFLARFERLQTLDLNSIKTDSLDKIGKLKSLKILRLTNIGNGSNLNPLANLTNLEDLIIQTPPSWDGGSKRIGYESLEPLSHLNKLKKLSLFDIQFKTDGLNPLCKLTGMKELLIRNQFTTFDFAELSIHLPDLKCQYTKPYTIWKGFEYYRCKKCNEMKVEFSGVDLKRRVFCLNCNKKRTDELIERFYEVKKTVPNNL